MISGFSCLRNSRGLVASVVRGEYASTALFFRKDVFIMNSGNCFVVGILVARVFSSLPMAAVAPVSRV